jgi:hypothetical protein
MWKLRFWIVGMGFAVAPVVAALAMFVWDAGTYGLRGGAAWRSFSMMLLVTVASTLVLAVPFYLLARQAQAVNLRTILGGGVVTTLIPLMLVLQGADGPVLLESLVAGVLGALSFWAIWRCGRTGS